MNTRIIPVEYNYVAPQTLTEALNILAKKKDVKVLAGGTDLIVELKCGADVKMQTMMDIKRIPDLQNIDTADGLKIGSTVKLSDIEDTELVKEEYIALEEALKAMAAIAVRHMGTMGGNFVNASPVADTAGPAMIFDAQVKVISAKGERTVPAREWFKGPGKCALEAGELVKEFVFPAVKANVGTAFIKKTRVKPDISKVSASVYVEKDGDKIADLRIAMGSVAATPLYLGEICKPFIGKEGTKAVFAEVAKAIANAIKPISDVRSTAEYRKQVGEVIVNDALALAWNRAGGVE